ncbi:MAG: patatin-like phospholipase family protein [Kiritimatiellae bacterium]|nr:patatin-like phospholipase family protein [Kiritimatiellia bacterium]
MKQVTIWHAILANLVFATPLLADIEIVSNSIALVLSGGGAKGAYEVGVWQALHDVGLADDIAAVSGTSIGAVNAALFSSWPDPKGAETLWLENLGKVFVPNDRILHVASEKKFAEFLDGELREYAEIAGVPASDLPEDSKKNIEKEAREEFKRKGALRDLAKSLQTIGESLHGEASDGLCDGDALRSVLEGNLPKNWPGETPRVYVTALASDEWKPRTFCLNEGTPEDRIQRLLASTAIPVIFPPVAIDGVPFVDGGWEMKGGDNVPLEPILENHPDIKTVIVVYLDDETDLNRERLEKNRADSSAARVRLIEIIPSKNIGGAFNGWQGVFDASPDTARRLIDLGRKDAEKTLLESGLAKAKDVTGGAMGMATNLWHKRPKLPFGKGKETQTR